MNEDQKRAAVPVAIILAIAYGVGMILAFRLIPRGEEMLPPIWLGLFGPFRLLFASVFLFPYLPVLIAVFVGWTVWRTVACIRRGSRASALYGAVCLALLWVTGILLQCMLANVP